MEIKRFWKVATTVLVLAVVFLAGCASPQPQPEIHSLMTVAKPVDAKYLDNRYCGEPARDAATRVIVRDAKVPAAFKRIHACPATGLTTGACPRWALDHVIPLDMGGCDAVWNMQWLPDWLKSCAGSCKDRWERKVNCRPVAEGGTGCVNELVKPPAGAPL